MINRFILMTFATSTKFFSRFYLFCLYIIIKEGEFKNKNYNKSTLNIQNKLRSKIFYILVYDYFDVRHNKNAIFNTICK